MNCDLCGKTAEGLAKAIIEGVQLDVCPDCTKFGRVISQPKRYSAKEQVNHMKRQLEKKEDKVELLVEDYSGIIKRKRESMGLSQKDFANRISEKESTIHKIETGSFEPDLSLARKLEKALGIKLVEHYEETHESSKSAKPAGFTLGDFIKVK
ncbi:TIGR00270 family protein [Candidatus Woesearchaeota archaeon]|nr:TIGR00270 family protein [Candidatus Woesearchaeota archaeon]